MSIIPSWGTGRPDYSQNVEYATIPIIRSHQRRLAATLGDYTTYSYDWPYVTAIVLYGSINDPTTPEEDAQQYNLYIRDVIAETEGKWWIFFGLVLYENYASYVANEDPLEYLASSIGYGRTEINFTKTYKYDVTQPYCMVTFLNVITDNPYPSLPHGWPPQTYNISFSIHSTEETTAGPVITG